MASLEPLLAAHLASGATTLARCWRVTRRDGVTLGFTDHDLDLSFEDTTFEASTGLDGATLEAAIGLSVDNGEALGALSAIGITEEDALAGRYDGASIEHWWVNWADVAQRVLILRGTLGELRLRGTAFEVELRGLSEALNRQVGRAYTPGCDCELGDGKCGVDLSQPAFSITLALTVAPVGAVVRVPSLDGYAEGFFAYGRLTWTSGANAGVVAPIKNDLTVGGERRLELWESPALPVEIGDTVSLTAGCDKRGETCRLKFNNFLNFRGFPHMPGEDWVTAYPRAGEVNEGGTQSWITYAHED
ncbi:MAG: DUF2163 domain-containing protein [Pseudomonadota bacterium]